MKIAYLHGFASSPNAVKGVALKDAFVAHGISIAIPDLNVPSFRRLSIYAMLETLDALDAAEGDGEGWAIVGSSLGGYCAARWSELHPERVQKLVLLCPAFDIGALWPRILPAGGLAMWESRGALILPDAGNRPTPVHYRFLEEAREVPQRPAVPCPTWIVHGTRDDRVPVRISREYVQAHPAVELIEVDDDHSLVASKDAIVALALRAFLGVES